MAAYVPPGLSQVARLLLGAPDFAVGWQEPVYLADPAAGAEWSYTVDGRYFERVLAVRWVFTTSAVVANRVTRVRVDSADLVAVASVPGSGTVVASSVLRTHLVVGAPAFASAAAGFAYGFLPDLLLPAGWQLHSVTAGLDAGDQYSNVRLLVQRYPNDAAVIPPGG